MPEPSIALIRNPKTGLLEVVDLNRPLSERRVASGPPPGVPVRAMTSREPVASGSGRSGPRATVSAIGATPASLAGHRVLYGAGEGVDPRPGITFGAPVIRRPTEVEFGTPVITRPGATAARISDMPDDQRERILQMAERLRAEREPPGIHPADAIGLSEADARREIDERVYARVAKSENDRLLMEQRMAARSPHLPLEVQAAGYVGQSPMPNVRPVTERVRNAANERLDDILVDMVEGSDPYIPPKPIVVETKRPLGAPKKRKPIALKYDVKGQHDD